MCFSAVASFSAGVVLTTIGVITIKKVETPSQLIFASIPLLFAIQQISEGFLWLALSNATFAPLEHITTYTFIFLAQIVWPLWVPLGIILLTKKENRKWLQKLIVVIGIILSAILGYCLLTYSIHAEIQGHHIKYFQNYPDEFRLICAILYITATIVPLFVSKIKGMMLLGVTILISYIISAVFYAHFILSVWCFFSSLISIIILRIIHLSNQSSSDINCIVDLNMVEIPIKITNDNNMTD